jgi:hypothetical protein
LSALTKIFVVLLVVMSLLLSAGLIVFVNKVEHYAQTAKTATDRADRERALAAAASAEAVAVRAERDRSVLEATRRAEALAAALEAANTAVAGSTTAVAAADARAREAEIDKAAAMTALTAAQQAGKVQEEAIVELRKQNDDVQKKYAEASIAVADLSQSNDALKAQLRNERERLAAMESQGGPGQATQARGAEQRTAVPAQPLKGVVRGRRNIGGVPYATISLGSSDSVAPGMRFRVLDQSQGNFLGWLTIQQVEANAATGRLEGTAQGVAAVKEGNPVITHYQ